MMLDGKNRKTKKNMIEQISKWAFVVDYQNLFVLLQFVFELFFKKQYKGKSNCVSNR